MKLTKVERELLTQYCSTWPETPEEWDTWARSDYPQRMRENQSGRRRGVAERLHYKAKHMFFRTVHPGLDDRMVELGIRALKLKSWCWTPGMLSVVKWLDCFTCKRVMSFDHQWESEPPTMHHIPDLTDAATVEALVQLIETFERNNQDSINRRSSSSC